jgi:putative hemolysin
MAAAELLLLLGLVLINGFFAMSELAIVSARRVRLKQRADAGSHGAQIALALSDEPTRFLSTVQIGIPIGRQARSACDHRRGSQCSCQLRRTPSVAEALAVIVVVALTFVACQASPFRAFCSAHADGIASRVAPVIRAIARITHPAVVLQPLRRPSFALGPAFGEGASGDNAIAEGAHKASSIGQREMLGEYCGSPIGLYSIMTIDAM